MRPACGAQGPLRIGCGYPTAKLFEASERGELALGGCLSARTHRPGNVGCAGTDRAAHRPGSTAWPPFSTTLGRSTLTGGTDPGWTHWRLWDDGTFGDFNLFRFIRRTDQTGRWTGTAWLNATPAIAHRAVGARSRPRPGGCTGRDG